MLDLRMKWLEDPGCWVFSDGRVAVPKGATLFYPKVSKNGDGYPSVNIHGRFKTVHRLIARAFIPNPLNKPQVDHIDRQRDNFSLHNLRWVTQSENQRNTAAFDRSIELYGVSGAVDKSGYMKSYTLVNKARYREYYLQHKEQIAKKQHEYHLKHKDEINQRHRMYRKTDK